MQLHRPCAHLPLHFITLFLQGKRDALVRLESFTEIMNQGEKKSVIMPTKQCLQKCYPSAGKTTVPPPASTSLPCSCLAVLPPEGTRATWPLISLCTHVVYQNNSSNNTRILLLPRPIASESSSLKRGSICSNATAQGLPSPMQSLARQFQ